MDEYELPLNPLVEDFPIDPINYSKHIAAIFVTRTPFGPSSTHKQRLMLFSDSNPYGLTGFEDLYEIKFSGGKSVSFVAYWNQNDQVTNDDPSQGNFGHIYLYDDPYQIITAPNLGVKKEIMKYFLHDSETLSNYWINPIMIIDVKRNLFLGNPEFYSPYINYVEEIFRKVQQGVKILVQNPIKIFHAKFLVQNGQVVIEDYQLENVTQNIIPTRIQRTPQQRVENELQVLTPIPQDPYRYDDLLSFVHTGTYIDDEL